MKLIQGKDKREENTKNQSLIGEHLGLYSTPGKSREGMYYLQWQVHEVLKNVLVTSSSNNKITCYLKKKKKIYTHNSPSQNILKRLHYSKKYIKMFWRILHSSVKLRNVCNLFPSLPAAPESKYFQLNLKEQMAYEPHPIHGSASYFIYYNSWEKKDAA